MLKDRKISYNPYFLFPFLVWIVVGGILLSLFTKQELFYAINTHYTHFSDVVMYYTTWLGEGGFIIITLLVSVAIPEFRNWWYFITAALCNGIPLLIQQAMKAHFNAPRPRLFFHDSTTMHFIDGWPSLIHNSFPSGHSEGAFSFFCFVSLVLPTRYRQWGYVCFLLALAVGYSRIYLAAHFFEDVYAGSIIGGVTTMIVYAIMFQFKDRLSNNKEITS